MFAGPGSGPLISMTSGWSSANRLDVGIGLRRNDGGWMKSKMSFLHAHG
jgi:hypothetical protein